MLRYSFIFLFFILASFGSRKLMVFVVACVGLFAKTLTSTDWVIIATSYITIEGVTNIVERLMKVKNVA
jgi:hypothetical protein